MALLVAAIAVLWLVGVCTPTGGTPGPLQTRGRDARATWHGRSAHVPGSTGVSPVKRAGSSEIFGETVEAWVQRDAAAAARWLDALPDGRERTAGLVRAVTQWSGFDPIAAGAFVATMPAGPARDQAIAVHVGILKIESPRVAALWLATLPAGDQPLGLIEEIAGDWLAINRAEAEIWLAQTPLPAERRQRVLAVTARDAQ